LFTKFDESLLFSLVNVIKHFSGIMYNIVQ
jgi:hypothetical protein